MIRALREERRNEDDKRWTREFLAEKANISPRTLERLENGQLVKVEVSMLTKLSNVFGLTTRERREFLLAAIGAQLPSTEQEASNSTVTFSKLKETLEASRLPSFVLDCFGDIVIANESVLALLNISPEFRRVSQTTPAGNNILFSLFHEQSGYKDTVGENWEKSIERNILFFRGVTLRYRATDKFQAIFTALCDEFRDFHQRWSTVIVEGEEDLNSNLGYYSYHRWYAENCVKK